MYKENDTPFFTNIAYLNVQLCCMLYYNDYRLQGFHMLHMLYYV